MATSVAEQIAAKVRNRLLTIDEDDGFETTVIGVERPERVSRFRPRDYQIVLTQGNITVVKELSFPGNPPTIAWMIPFIVSGNLMPSKRETTAIDTLKNQFWSDCIKAICTPQSSWYNWDNLAVTSEFGDVQNYVGEEGDVSGFQFTLAIVFRTPENDPFTVR